MSHNVSGNNYLIHNLKLNIRIWNDLYGVRDMRAIWFKFKPNPTKVEVVFQVKEIIDLSLAAETLHVSGVLDIEWTDKRLSWTGFCDDPKSCPDDYHDKFEDLNASRYQSISKGGL